MRERRQLVWDTLTRIGLSRDKAWCLIVDFNELMASAEKLGGPVRREASFWGFRNMAENCKVREIRHTGNWFSWAGWRDSIWIQCRLDRSFGNDEWFRLFPRAQLEYMSMWASDHRPLRLSFSLEREDCSRGRFFFDKRWLSRVGFEDIIQKSWDGNSTQLSSVMDRISNCRRAVAQWKKRSDCNSKTRIQRLQQELELEIAKADPSRSVLQQLRLDLALAYREEEIFWRDKSRELWLKEGDRNTSFFFNSVKGKRLQNKVLMLLDKSNEEQFSEGAKGHVAVEYFRELFMSTNPHDLDSLFQGIQPKVSEEMNSRLTAPVTTEEIKAAAFSVKGSSAPGEDGLTGIFYQRFWHIVGPAVVKEVQSFFSSAILPSGWNHTHISLLPKIQNPVRMTDMRPISLCSVQYKIVSKILCNRLKQFLPELISETQGAFVSGRLITDNILIAHEMVHGLRTNDKVSPRFMAINTDMSKAYDRVEWSFLETLLEKMGFGRTWVTWIMACVSSVSYSVLLNGNTHGFIKPERGIRQGDPLSPFLFILAAEALVGCLNHSEQNGSLHGIRLSRAGPAVHHLLFADDSLLMCEASEEEAAEVVRCLKLYGDASGQMINTAKSSIIFGSQVAETNKTRIKEVLVIDREGGEGTYLGLPECFHGSKSQLLSFVQERVQGRVNGWFAKSLSQGGKEVLIKAIGLAMPVYAMSCFKLPKNICKKITSALTQFWWGSRDNQRKIPWVAWKHLCRSKDNGGLGFRDIEIFNQALLGKQAWRIWQSPDSLLAQILKHRYFNRSSFLTSSLGTRPSYAWRSLLHGRDLLAKGLLRSIGDGIGSNVWMENWIMDVTPRPPKYRADSVVDLSLEVADLINEHTGLWNVTLVHETFAADDVPRVLNTKFCRNKPDSLVWSFTTNGMYTSHSGYRLLDAIPENQLMPQQPVYPLEKSLWKRLWKMKAPPKLKHFLWKALSGALAVKERLASRSINLDTTCTLCGEGSETICHVLFTCAQARATWSQSGFPLPRHGFSTNSVFLNVHYLLDCSSRAPSRSLQLLSFPWLLWQIWKSRNAFLFESTRYEPNAIVQKALDDAEIWLSLNHHIQPSSPTITVQSNTNDRWKKPALNVLKCNIGVDWSPWSVNCGVAWIIRNHSGIALFHSRRSYVNVHSPMEAELLSFLWAIESVGDLNLNRVIFESSLELAREALLHSELYPAFRELIRKIQSCLSRIQIWSLDHTLVIGNRAALLIASSVIRQNLLQSYVARRGPSWISHILQEEAAST